jgi:hypothetical protein
MLGMTPPALLLDPWWQPPAAASDPSSMAGRACAHEGPWSDRRVAARPRVQDPQIAKAMQTAPSRKEGSTAKTRRRSLPRRLLVSNAAGYSTGVRHIGNRLAEGRRSGDRARRHVVVSRPHPEGRDVASLSTASKAICALLPRTDERFDRVLSWFTSSGASTTPTTGASCTKRTACCVRPADSD